MPIPTGVLRLLKFQQTEGESRTCSICGAPLAHLTDGYKSIDKCLQCGYAHAATGSISEQGKHDFVINVNTVDAKSNAPMKKGFIELYQPLDEQLFNALISAGRDAKKARDEVARDLDLKDDNLEYFEMKINFLGGSDGGDDL